MEAQKTPVNSIKESPCGNVSGPDAFITAHEEVEDAYDALLALEREFQCAAAGQISRRRCGESKLLHSLNMECVNFLARQNMATSSEWGAAWHRFESAVQVYKDIVQEMRGQMDVVEVTHVEVEIVTVTRAS